MLDLADAAAERLGLYDVDHGAPRGAASCAAVLVAQAEKMEEAVRGLRNMKKNPSAILEACKEMNVLENQADTLTRRTMAKLFKRGNDPLTVMKWKEIIDSHRGRDRPGRGRRERHRGRRPRARLIRAPCSTRRLVVVVLIAVALAFDFINGFHDAANSIATVVSTRVLSPLMAVAWAAFFNFISAAPVLWGAELKVAATMGKGIVDFAHAQGAGDAGRARSSSSPRSWARSSGTSSPGGGGSRPRPRTRSRAG